MELNQMVARLANVKKGKYVGLTKKMDLGNGVEKISNIVVRLGVNYNNMKVAEGKEPSGNGLPWGQWLENYAGYIIEHKGNYYLRVASSYAKNTKTKYIKDGSEIAYSEALELVGDKKIKSNRADIMNIKLDNIIRIGL